MTPNHALLLAAGRGSRMGQLTSEQPKCFAKLAGHRLFDWQRAALHAAGLDTLGIVTGYHGEMFQNSGCEIYENERWESTNMVASLACAARVLREHPCVVSYSDIVYHPDSVRRLVQSEADVSITYDLQWLSLWQTRFDDPLSDAETLRLRDGRIIEIGGRTQDVNEIEGQFMGLLKFSPAGWAAVEEIRTGLSSEARDRLDCTSLLQRLIAAGVSIVGVPVEGRWCEADTGEDLEAYERKMSQPGWSHDWTWPDGPQPIRRVRATT